MNSISQAAEELNCSRQKVWLLIKMKELKATKVGCYYAIPSQAIEAYKKRNPTSEKEGL
jgi:excisionase family DNA binding protein